MMCARHSRVGSSRPDPRPGRRRARLSLLLPALALLLGALGLFSAAPAQAQTVWSATLTVKSIELAGFVFGVGCATGFTGAYCSSTSVLTEDEFSLGGKDYTVDTVQDGTDNLLRATFRVTGDAGADFKALNFCVGSTAFALSSFDDTSSQGVWSTDVGWSVGDTVKLSIGSSCAPPTVTLSVSPNPVTEGSPVTVTVTLSRAMPSDVTIPVTVTDGTAESGDHGALSSITIPAGSTSATGDITTAQDSDVDDETFTVALGTLPSPLTGGATTSVEVTIQERPTVSLSASPNPVLEGSVVTVTAKLSRALSGNVNIPVTVTDNTAESGDHGTLSALTITAGSTSGGAQITTAQDTDEDDETFTVALGTLPSSLMASTMSSVEVTITDDDRLRLSVDTSHPTPACGATVTDLTLRPELGLRLTPPPAAATDTQVRILASYGPAEGWRASLPIRNYDHLPTYGHSSIIPNITFAELQKNFPGFRGFEYRLKDTPGITAQCTWQIDDYDSGQQESGAGGQQPEAGAGGDGGAVVGAARVHPYSALVAKMYGWRNDPKWVHAKDHTDRWDRALKAFGEPVADASLVRMSAAEAQAFADRGWTRWVEVAQALREIESAGPENPALATPVVTIAVGNPVTEGAPAGFTLTAAPAPASDLAVAVTVGQTGDVAQGSALGARTVTIPAGTASAAFTVATVDDNTDEPDGAVTAALGSGAGYTLGAAKRATVTVADDDQPPVTAAAIVTKRSTAREGSDAAVRFAVRLEPTAPHTVTVDYATADGAGRWAGTAPARAGADYTATSGTLTFAPGQAWKFVEVPILDDSIDEGTEYFLLRFSNPRGARLAAGERETQGLIRNSDPLQAMWLARFGRMVASDAVKTVTARFETPRDAGSHLTLAGQRLDLSGGGAGDGRALADAMTGLARAFGAEVTAADDDPFAQPRLSDPWNDPTAAAPHSMTGRELLLGTSFRAVLGQGAGSQWTSWGQGASVSHFSAAVPGLNLSGESATGSMGMDYERGRLLAGFAMTHSVGEGTARDAGWHYALGSTATMMVPYGRFALTERISAWTLAGTGSGSLTLDLDGAVAQRYRTDLSMTLAAAGVRGDLLTPAEAGGFALALKADAFWVRTESDRVTASEFGNLMGARGDSSRVRAVLDGSRTFSLAGGATLAPSLELGVRHDGGDAETGTGLEFGAGLGYADPSRGLDMALRVHGLAVHAEDGYDEWGVSGQLRLVPGAAGRGLSASLTPSFGVDPGGSERLWALPASSGLAANGDAVPSSRLDTELGYGLPVFGGGFTGTPNVGLGLSGDGARDLRLGWRLTPAAASGATGFELSVDATRREAGGDDAEHGVMLRSRLRW